MIIAVKQDGGFKSLFRKQQSIASGNISEERYNSYIKIYKEAKYNEMSYVKKRQKDKQFGKFFHSTMKDVKKMKGR